MSRLIKRYALITLQAALVVLFIFSVVLLLLQVSKIVGGVRYYQKISSKKLDAKVHEGSDAASRLEEELLRAAESRNLPGQEFDKKRTQLHDLLQNLERDIDNYRSAQ